MNKFRFTIKILAIAIFMFAFASLAQAQATRTWVSGVGDDANPCSRTAPCKTFAGAISKTAANGEIDALDPGGFGAVTITKSITIDACCMAGILAAGTNGVNVNASGIVVTLRHISINGVGTGINGINYVSGASLTVEHCVINGFTGSGITQPSSTGAFNEIHLRDVEIHNCTTAGVNVANTGTNATFLTFDDVNITRCGSGLAAGNGTRGQISRSLFGSNTTGISASQVGSQTDFTVNDSTITANNTGITTGASTHVRIARVVITGNTNALGLGGLVDTGGNNTIMGNGTDQSPNGALKIQN